MEERYYELEEEIGTPTECALRYVHAHPEEFFLSEREAAADNDACVARLAARVGPVERAGAGELAAAEAEVGRPFPPLLQRLWMEVGAAGWGPERGGTSTVRAPAMSGPTRCCPSSARQTARRSAPTPVSRGCRSRG